MLLDMILHGLRYGRIPEHIHFDMNLNDYCCLNIPDFGRSFPPGTGYTFMSWIQVERFDAKTDIPILTMICGEEKLRLRLTIEGGASRKIRLQTFKSNVRFEGHVVQEKEWFHLAIVHQKPRMTNSFADLYINGKLIEHIKCGYLGHPGSAEKIRTHIGIAPDHAPGDRVTSVWNVGPTYFIEETLLDAKAMRTICEIGHEYAANFQGSLSKYETNESQRPVGLSSGDASAVGDAGTQPKAPTTSLLTSLLSRVTNSSGGAINISEDKIVFAVRAQNALEICLKSHSSEGFPNIVTTASRLAPITKVLFSHASPKLPADPGASPMLLQTKGEMLFVCPDRIADGIWKLGGCAILLCLIEKSQTTEALFKSVSALVEAIRHNWRNADDMERN
ncbi:hypothetical protein HK101_006561, partial [Irineochytrium annulatum]